MQEGPCLCVIHMLFADTFTQGRDACDRMLGKLSEYMVTKTCLRKNTDQFDRYSVFSPYFSTKPINTRGSKCLRYLKMQGKPYMMSCRCRLTKEIVPKRTASTRGDENVCIPPGIVPTIEQYSGMVVTLLSE